MQNKLLILIVEDELLIAEMLSDLLLEFGYDIAGIAKNFNQAVFFLENKPNINFVFLDINLGGSKSGIDIANYINEKRKIPFIYTTAHITSEIIDKALLTNPSAYLVKPYNAIDLYTTLQIHKSKNVVQEKTIIVKDGHLLIKINLNEILWIHSDNNYLDIHTINKKYLVRNSIESFLNEIKDTNFIRVHRSYAVNVQKILAVNGQYVQINLNKIPLSRKFRDTLLLHFNNKG